VKALKGAGARLRDMLLRRRADLDMDEELRFHIQMETEKNIGLGLDPPEARRRALVAFGGVERRRSSTSSGRRDWSPRPGGRFGERYDAYVSRGNPEASASQASSPVGEPRHHDLASPPSAGSGRRAPRPPR